MQYRTYIRSDITSISCLKWCLEKEGGEMKNVNITYKELDRGVRKVIKGQDKQIKQLCGFVLRHYKQIGGFDYSKGERHIVMLVRGPSGSGKTATVEAIASNIGVDVCHIFCSQITADGYKGINLPQIIANFYESIGYDKKRMENCIIIIDEFDKVLIKNTLDVYNRMDQTSYLKLLDGGEIALPTSRGTETINTNNILIILAGAFLDLDELLKNKKKGTGLIKNNEDEDLMTSEIKGLQELGMMDEIIGRIGAIIKFDQNSKETIKEIIHSKHSMFGLWKIYFLGNYGVKLSISDEALEQVAEMVSVSPLGVRALNQCLNPILLDAVIDVELDYDIAKLIVDVDDSQKLICKTEKGKRKYVPLCLDKKNHIKLPDILYKVGGYEETIEIIAEELTNEFGCICTQMNYMQLIEIRSLYKSILMYLSSEVKPSDSNTGSVIKLLEHSFETDPKVSTFEVMLKEKPAEHKKDMLSEYLKFKRSGEVNNIKVQKMAIQAVKNYEINRNEERRFENE